MTHLPTCAVAGFLARARKSSAHSTTPRTAKARLLPPAHARCRLERKDGLGDMMQGLGHRAQGVGHALNAHVGGGTPQRSSVHVEVRRAEAGHVVCWCRVWGLGMSWPQG